MHTMHIVLTAISGVGFVVALAGPGKAWGAVAGPAHGRLLGAVVCGAAMVGNAASLLPTTPAWYGRGMAAITALIAGWALLRLLTTGRPAPMAPEATAPPASPKPALRYRVVDTGIVNAEIVDAEIVDEFTGTQTSDRPATPGTAEGAAADADYLAEVVSLASRRTAQIEAGLTAATQETFDARLALEMSQRSGRGLRGAQPSVAWIGRSTAGSTVVAANLAEIARDPRRARTQEPAVRRSLRPRVEDPKELGRRLRAAYAPIAPESGSLASYQA